jgi:hypothetical protein
MRVPPFVEPEKSLPCKLVVGPHPEISVHVHTLHAL